MRGLLLSLLLISPAWAANTGPVRVTVSAPLAPAAGAVQSAIHPALAGSLSDAANPLSQRLSLRAGELRALVPVLTPSAAAVFAEPLMSSDAHPADRAAAGVLLRRLEAEGLAETEPAAQESLWSRLLQSARSDPAVTALFEGKPAALELGGVSYKGDRVIYEGKKVPQLGRGEFGVVVDHPAMPGAVIKTVSLSAGVLMMSNATPDKAADNEERTARRLAQAGAGPAYLGRAVIERRLLSVREKVYGNTLETLFWDRGYKTAEHGLVMELFDRLADAGVMVDDLRSSNIMIGVTLRDPRLRAYVVDGGNLVAVGGLSRDELRRAIEDRDIHLAARFDRDVGLIETIKPVSLILREGLERSLQKPLWDRVKAFFGRTPSAS